MKNIIKLSTISEIEAKNHAVLKVKSGTIIIRGNETNGYDFKCGNCDETLATGIFHQQIQNIVFVCSKCKKYNQIKSDWKVYVLKYLKEEVNYIAVAIGLFLMIFVSASVNLPVETKVFIDISIFIMSFSYKYLVQIFQEK